MTDHERLAQEAVRIAREGGTPTLAHLQAVVAEWEAARQAPTTDTFTATYRQLDPKASDTLALERPLHVGQWHDVHGVRWTSMIMLAKDLLTGHLSVAIGFKETPTLGPYRDHLFQVRLEDVAHELRHVAEGTVCDTRRVR